MTPEQLRAALERLGLTQAEAARRLGVTLRSVQHWVSGSRKIGRPVAMLVEGWLKAGGPGRT